MLNSGREDSAGSAFIYEICPMNKSELNGIGPSKQCSKIRLPKKDWNQVVSVCVCVCVRGLGWGGVGGGGGGE